MESNTRVLAGETIGTAIFVLGGLGSAVLGQGLGTLGTAIGFGLAFIVAAAVVGHASGAHLNPAVSIAMVLARKARPQSLPFALLGQLLGASLGALGVWGIARGVDGFSAKNHFFQNGWDRFSPGGYGVGAIVVVEVVFTAIWVAVVLSTEHRNVAAGASVVIIGLTVTLLHLVTIPIDNTGLNPVRSLASALFAGSDAWTELWVFIVCPLLGSLVGVLVWLAVDDTKLEATMMWNPALAQARDLAERAVDDVVVGIEHLEPPTN